VSQWTKHHRALLNALRADKLVPKLVARLSLERLSARPAHTRMLRDWVVSLRSDPGWQVLAAHLDHPRAFQRAWRNAVEAGFSGRTDHHHALFFERMCTELVAEHDFEVARFAFGECVDAWLRVFDSGWADALLAELSSPDISTQRRLLHRLADRREAELRDALLCEQGEPGQALDRRRARFAWGALEALSDKLDAVDAPHPALAGLAERVASAKRGLRGDLLARFDDAIDAIDLTDGSFEGVLGPFHWIGQVFTILPIDESAASRVTQAAVDLGWKLRQLDADAAALIGRLLTLAEPFNDELETLLENKQAFGHNSACADFLVFRGEQFDDGARRVALFERALSACPGHRNAAMMLSYEKLRQANDLLTRMRLTPAAVKVVPGATGRLEATAQQASALVEEAERLFPSNENISEYRRDVAAQAQRLGAELDD
jgi:hypothetical protein